MSDIKDNNAPNSISAGATPQTPLGELTQLPRPLAGFKGPTSKGKLREGKGRGSGGEGKREGEREEGRLVIYTFIWPWLSDI